MSCSAGLADVLDVAIRFLPVAAMVATASGMCWKLVRLLRALEKSILGRLDLHGDTLRAQSRSIASLDETLCGIREYVVRHGAEYDAGMARLVNLERRVDRL